jgi:hypothetical protein
MTENGWAPPGSLIVCVLAGRLSYQKELGLPFLMEVVAEAEPIGFRNEDVDTTQRQFPSLPPFPPDVLPQATIGGEDLLIGFGLYIASKIGEGIIGDLAHDIYERIVKASLRRLWEKHRQEGDPLQVTATFDHWFDGSGVLVRVVVHSGPTADTDGTLTTSAVTAALHQAVAYLRTHPVTHRVMTYEVHDGRVGQLPTLSEPIGPQLAEST